MENEKVNDNTMNDCSLSFEEDNKGNDTLDNYTNTRKNKEYYNKGKDENTLVIQPMINRNNYSNSDSISKSNNTHNKDTSNKNNDGYDNDDDDDPIANAFYDLPIYSTNVNNKNQNFSINNTMMDNSQYNYSKSHKEIAEDSQNNKNKNFNSIHYLFPNRKVIEEKSLNIPLCPHSKEKINVDANIQCDISNLYTINNHLNYSTNKPLWYILNEYTFSCYGPISSIGLLTLYREKKINGATKIKPLDIFKPIKSQETYSCLANICQPNYLIDNYTVNPELNTLINQVDLSVFDNCILAIQSNNAQIKNDKSKKNSRLKKTKGNELIIKHKYE